MAALSSFRISDFMRSRRGRAGMALISASVTPFLINAFAREMNVASRRSIHVCLAGEQYMSMSSNEFCWRKAFLMMSATISVSRWLSGRASGPISFAMRCRETSS